MDVKRWLKGPEFLWKDESSWVNQGDKKALELNEDNPEVKVTVTVIINKGDDEKIVPQILNRFLSWCRMLRVITWIIRWINMVRQSVNEGNAKFDRKVSIDSLSVGELKVVELKIIQAYQNIYFENKIKISNGITSHKMLERIGSLSPFIGSCEILRVGRRLEKSMLDESVTHPIILPKSGKVTELLIRWCHQKAAHTGTNITLNEIRSSGLYMIQGSSAVKKVISRCVICRRLRGRVGEQIMADLPHEKLKEEFPFTHCGVNIFGPFLIKDRRNTMKRYGALFTYLASCAIHIEMIKNMDTGSLYWHLEDLLVDVVIYEQFDAAILWDLRES